MLMNTTMTTCLFPSSLAVAHAGQHARHAAQLSRRPSCAFKVVDVWERAAGQSGPRRLRVQLEPLARLVYVSFRCVFPPWIQTACWFFFSFPTVLWQFWTRFCSRCAIQNWAKLQAWTWPCSNLQSSSRFLSCLSAISSLFERKNLKGLMTLTGTHCDTLKLFFSSSIVGDEDKR